MNNSTKSKINFKVWWAGTMDIDDCVDFPAKTLREAKKFLTILEEYDSHLNSVGLRDGYGIGGVQYHNGDEWIEWTSDDGGDIWADMQLDKFR